MKSQSKVKQKPVHPIPSNVGALPIAISFIWSLAWIFFFVYSIYDYSLANQKYQCFANNGVEVEGEITDRQAPGSSIYKVKYRYSFMSEKERGTFEEWQQVPYKFYKLRNHPPVKVLLCSKEPSLSVLPEFSSEPGQSSLIGALLITTLPASLGIFFFYTFLRNKNWRYQLSKSGQNVGAHIVERRVNKSIFEGRRQVISYQFQVEDEKQTRQVVKAEFNRNIFDKFRVGDAIEVRYVRSKPEISEVLSEKEPEAGWNITPSRGRLPKI